MMNIAAVILLIALGSQTVFGQTDVQNVLGCANVRSGVCRLQCRSDELSVFPVTCSLYTFIFGVPYQRCVTSMPCCYWNGRCQTACGAHQVQASSQATCSSAAYVCCIPDSQVPPATATPLITTTPTPRICGTLTDTSTRYPVIRPRLLGAVPSGRFDWPWMVRLTYTTSQGFCAGVLVDEDTVVTAAHCVAGVDASTMRIVVGEYDISIYDLGEEAVGVAWYVVAPSFVRGTRGHDYAVLRLARSIIFTNVKLPVCLPDPGIPLLNPLFCYVAGWGVSEQGVGGPLRAMNVRLLDRQTCEQQLRLRQGGPVILPLDIVCTDNPLTAPSDGCLYDDGDMLVCRDTKDRWNLVGVLSEYSCGEGLPILFTDVRRYTDFTLNLL